MTIQTPSARPYLLDLAERVAASFAAGALSALGGDVVNLWAVDWRAMLGIGGGAAVVSFFKGLAGRFRGDPATASLLGKG